MPSPTEIGRQAETAAAAYLKSLGYTIRAQNWRTRWCEIDIVAQKDTTVVLVEVKYRATAAWGGGLEYITPRKQAQMAFAAQFWIATHKWSGDIYLGALEVTGPHFAVTAWLPSIDA